MRLTRLLALVLASLLLVYVAVLAETAVYDKNGVEGAATNAFDGDPATQWVGRNNTPSITLDLGDIETLTGMDIAFAFANGQQTAIRVEASQDGAVWETILPFSFGTSDLGFQTVAFAEAITAQYVRITGFYNNSGEWSQWISISEVQFINDAGGTVVPVACELAGGVEEESYQEPCYGENVFDGNTANESRWSCQVDWAYIAYDFSADPQRVTGLIIDFVNSENVSYTFDVMMSTDNSPIAIEWTYVVMTAVSEKVAGPQTFMFDLPVTARYLKVQFNYSDDTANPDLIAINEISLIQ